MADQATISSTIGPTEPASTTGDWPAQAADTVVRLVDSVKEKTTDRAIVAVRAIVYGLLTAVLGITALVLVIILLIRFIDVYLPDAIFGEEHMWAAFALVGALFVIAGAVLWSRRHASVS